MASISLRSVTIGRASGQCSVRRRTALRRAVGLVLGWMLVAGAAGCRGLLSPQYEYEEDVRLALDGSATVFVHASVPALAALRGLDVPLDSRGRPDRQRVSALFETPVTRVGRVTTSSRDGRQFVHVRVEVDDVRRLGQAAPFAWSHYTFDFRDGLLVYRQDVGDPSGRVVSGVGWDGRELVAVRLHVPSRIPYHNQPQGRIDRGNILAWEQPLAARLAGTPLEIEVHMETSSILRHTLTLFAMIIGLVAATFAAVIWIVMRRAPAAADGAGRAPAPIDPQRLPSSSRPRT
jgi:hypothetical protein